MNIRFLQCILCFAVLMGLSHIATAQEEDKTDIVAGFGVIISPDYNDVLDDTYSEYSVSGGYGWIDFQLGVQFKATEQFSITPSVDLLVNFGSGDVSFINTIVVPSISAQYAFKTEPSLYVRGEVNYGIPNIDADFDADSDGLGFGGALGYAFGSGVDIELGYLELPVEVNDSSSKNFGGILLKLKGSF